MIIGSAAEILPFELGSRIVHALEGTRAEAPA